LGRKKRILVDGHVFDSEWQGTCSYINGIYSAIARDSSAEIFIATAERESLDSTGLLEAGAQWIQLETRGRFDRLFRSFNVLCDSLNPDYCHFQYVTPFFKRSKWITTIHDLLFVDFPQYFPLSYRIQRNLAFRYSALRSDYVLTVSEYSKRRISESFGISEQSIIVTPNGIDNLVDIEPEPVEGLVNSRFFLYVSRLEPRKRQHLLLDAFSLADVANDTKLVLVGSAALQYGDLENRLNAPENSGRVVHLHDLTNRQLVWLYQNALAHFYPSECEGFGIPPLEALVLGTPSYCADNTALSELRDFVSGFVDFRDTAGVARLMAACQDKRPVPSENSKRVLDTYSWMNGATKLLDIVLSD